MVFQYLIILYYKYRLSQLNKPNNLIDTSITNTTNLKQHENTQKSKYNNSSFKDLWEMERNKINYNNI